MNKLDAMQMFVRVAEAGSFIAVARQLQVARSVVTRQVVALEQHLGTQLITRSTRSLALTAAGAAYLEQCRHILNMVDAAESGLSAESTVPRGRIRLGLPLSFGLIHLMPALLDFAREQARIELIMDLSDQRANLIEEGLDLAIRITADLQPGDIVRKLGQCRLHTLASPEYLAQHGTPRHPLELKRHECLLYASDTAASHWQYREDGHTLQVPVHGRIVANNGVMLAEAAARGMGIARQPDFIVAPYLARGQLRTLLHKFEAEPLGIYAVLPGNRYIPHRVSVLMDHLSAALKANKSSPPAVKPTARPARRR
ncbi:MAG: LysR family transcriptional regulator [Betaproteobacteria bacterium]|nr:LysR family transcriptional regulator [Betaproteobacteria bacterium]